MNAQAQVELVYRDARALRQRIRDLEPALPPGVTTRPLEHDLDEFEESLGTLVLQAFHPSSTDTDAGRSG